MQLLAVIFAIICAPTPYLRRFGIPFVSSGRLPHFEDFEHQDTFTNFPTLSRRKNPMSVKQLSF
ncbi:MAG: hypothetical protein WCQ03_10235, partial [Phycisphaerae bacterium]